LTTWICSALVTSRFSGDIASPTLDVDPTIGGS
jgi:hypothetical protein